VAQKIRKAMPDVEIIFAADDDWKTVYPEKHEKAGQLWNVGIIAATAAAEAVNGSVWVPIFGDNRGDKDTDFNDLHVLDGLDTVSQQFYSSAKVRDEIIPPMIEVTFDKSDKNAVKESTASVEAEMPNNSVSVNKEPPYPEDHTVHDEPALTGSDVKPFVVSRHNVVMHYNLDATDKGVPFTSTANILRVLQCDQNLYRKIWFDEFLGRIMTVWGSTEPREWADIDDINLQIYLQESLGMPKLGKFTVADAVHAVAYADTRNECQAYITGLEWDGVERLPTFMQNVYGVTDSEYHRGVSQIFWISMIARAMTQGCQMRTMIVLEGLQNAGKSRSLDIIGGKWFAEATSSPTDKDFYLTLKGKLLLEIGEMDAFNRADVNKIKQVISCRSDNYRAPYERRASDHPRSCVFAGTTNRDDWNKDETGGTRFLPITCVKVDLPYIIQHRDQLFAEAFSKFKTIPEYWNLVPLEDAKREQEARRDHDTLEDDILAWLKARTEVTVRDIMGELMDLELAKQDRATQMRVAKCLRAMGWIRVKIRKGNSTMMAWQKVGSVQELAL
jgi:putative DNA primase/helicase